MSLAKAKPLLDFIAKPESGGDYNRVWGGIEPKDQPPRALTSMTIGEVLAWQQSIDARYPSEAAGRYQIMEDTLRDIYQPAGFRTSDKFDETTQDGLAYYLLRRRGYGRFYAGEMDADDFANSLAKEWASLPVVTGPKKGMSHYSGDGLNKSHVSVTAFLEAVRAARGDVVTTPQPQTQTQTGGGAMFGTTALAARIILYILSGNLALSGVDIDTTAGTITLHVEQIMNVLLGGGGIAAALGWRKIAKAMGGKT